MRIISQAAIDLLDSGTFGRRTLIRFDMPSGAVGYWDDAYPINFQSLTYQPAPGGFKVPAMSHSTGLVVHRQEIIFNNLDPRVAAQVENEQYQGRPAFIYVALVDPAIDKIVDVVSWFSGKIDQAPVREKVGGDSTLTVKLVSNNWELNRKGTRTRSDTDQRQLDALDGFFKFNASSVSEPPYWGRKGPQYPS